MIVQVETPVPSSHPPLQRAIGAARLSVLGCALGGAKLERLYQQGSAKIRFSSRQGAGEAVLVNTAGGVAEGDRFSWGASLGPGARQTITTQACEKVYRGRGEPSAAPADVQVALKVGPGARLDWLPQETILFDRAHLNRRLEADLAEDGELLVLEAVVLGRKAMGEAVGQARLHDRWRIKRGGRLLFADDVRLNGPLASVSNAKALLAGAGAYASVLLASPDAEDRLDLIRPLLPAGSGASAWGGKLFARVLAADGLALRRVLIPLLTALRGGEPLPRLWTI